MVRHTATNIRLPTTQWKRLKLRAAEEGLSLSGLVREMAETYLRTTDEKALQQENDSFFDIGEDPGESGTSDTSASHDHVLYPARRKARRSR